MPARASSAVSVLLMVAVCSAGCGGRTVVVTPRQPVTAAQLAELWVDPGPSPRDVFWGVGGPKRAPAPDVPYTVIGKDSAGFSVSYDVTGPDGTEWSAKLGPEAQTEVVVSRLLWGLGYHQPPTYYLPSWTVAGEDNRKESEARFRPKLAELDRLEQVWSWADNPFSGTRELKGLLVILLMLNSTDLKDDNNSIYEVQSQAFGRGRPSTIAQGASSGVERRWFVVRDLGASLGETGKLYPRRNWLEGFERQAFITDISDAAVDFDYDGRHEELLSMIGPGDVQWAARRMARLTERQWRDAFRAGNYAAPRADRYIARIQEKIADGLALRVDRRAIADDERR